MKNDKSLVDISEMSEEAVIFKFTKDLEAQKRSALLKFSAGVILLGILVYGLMTLSFTLIPEVVSSWYGIK